MKKLKFRRRASAALAGSTLAWASALAAGPGPSDLEDLQALLNQPVYAASKFAQDAVAAPAAVTVLTSGDIRAYGWRTLAEVLNGVRGVYFRNDRFYRYVGVRGFARPGDFSSRLLVLIDGMRVNDNIYDQAGVGREFPLDVGLIERVEFIPGPGSALYGSNAVLGVVNIVTKSAAVLRGGVAQLELGSGRSRALGVTQGLEFGEARLVLSAKSEVRPGSDHRYAEYASPENGDGVNPDADRETDRKLYAKWTQGGLTVSSLWSERTKQIPTGAFDTAFPSRHTQGMDRYAFADVQWQQAAGDQAQLYLRTTLAQYDFQGRFDYGPVDGLQRLQQRGRWLGAEGRWQYNGWQRQRVVLGVELQRNLMERQRSTLEGATTEVQADIDGSSERYGFFVNDEISLTSTVRAVLGARLDRQRSGDHSTTPRLALLWEPAPGLVLKLLTGRAFREPNAYESQYSDNTALANPALRSETLRARELAADWRALPTLRLAASLYRYRVANLIEQQADADTGLLRFDNVGGVDAHGTELEADWVDTSGWRLRGNLSRQRTSNRDGSGQLGNSPESLAKLHFSLPLPRWQARAGLEWLRMGKRLTVAGARLPTHTLTNLTLQVLPPASRLSLSASLYNLFDRSHADPGGPELRQDSVAQDGRQWRVQLALQF